MCFLKMGRRIRSFLGLLFQRVHTLAVVVSIDLCNTFVMVMACGGRATVRSIRDPWLHLLQLVECLAGRVLSHCDSATFVTTVTSLYNHLLFRCPFH